MYNPLWAQRLGEIYLHRFLCQAEEARLTRALRAVRRPVRRRLAGLGARLAPVCQGGGTWR